MPREKQVKMREKWRQYQRKYREKKRVLAEVLNLTPPSLNSTSDDQLNVPPEPIVDAADHDYVQPSLERPRASSTPMRAVQKSTSKHRAVLKEREKLRFELIKIRKELKSERMKTKKLQRKVDKLKVKKVKDVSVSNKKRDKKKIAEEKRERVVSFLCRDENSRMLSGKKDTVTKNKIKHQRRVLLHSLKDLHSNYNTTALKHHAISYRQFLRYCPFYVTQAKESDRNTCSCFDHDNFKMIVDRLCQKGILLTNSISELLEAIVCDSTNQKCMYRLCAKCCYNEVEFEGPLDNSIITWEQWERIVVTVEEKTCAKYHKIEKSGSAADLLSLLNKKLDAFTRHQFNWLHQTRSLRELKHSLLRDELCIHIDFSENYGCKLNREVQPFHFGSSRKQATIHTCVVYTGNANHTYATISDCLRHDERAVWAHLEPVVRDAMTKCETPPSSLHIISDGPVTQYRNRKNFYLLSTVPFLLGFKSVTWNFSEKAHGKGAPDGVGATVKRIADTAVQRGKDLQTPEDVYDFLIKQKSTIHFYWISEEDVAKFDEKVPELVPAVKGTMKLHQVISTEPATILYRDISCFCSRPAVICKCYNPSRVDFRNVSEAPEPPSLNQRGKFIVVNYEDKPFVGQITQVVGDEIEVSCMKQLSAKNVFTWPQPPDLLFYYEADVLFMISEPEPVNSRHSRLTTEDWKKFQTQS